MIKVGKLGIVRLTGKDMVQLRRDVFERDGYRCKHFIPPNMRAQFCNKLVSWEYGHLCHIKSRGAGGSDTTENTFVGCAECHMKSHNVGGKPCPTKPS